ncbi:hypothetical protein N9023_02080 [Opitutaceae bacterium]|nr:hypothetical protein [Opitutaceae bacterium]
MSRRCLWWFGIVGGLLVLNGFWGVARFQVNGLWGDQWSFYTPLFEGAGWAEIFNWQHGPHRQGVAFLLTAGVLELSQWDARIDSLWIYLQLVAATGLALNLKRRFAGSIQLSDVWIVVGGLSLISYETIMLVPNASHSVFPLLGLMVLANIWPENWTMRRGTWVGLAVVILVFTGFGIFPAVLAMLLLVVSVIRGVKTGFDQSTRATIWAGVIALMGGLLFARGYVFAPASEGFAWWGPATSDYGRFILLMLASRGGWDGESVAAYGFGLVVCGVGLVALARALRLLLANADRRKGEVAVLLIGTTFAFALFTALGRTHVRIDAGMASRYMALLLPLWWGADLVASGSPSKWARHSVTGLGMIMAVGPWVHLADRPPIDWAGTVGMRDGDLQNLRSFQSGKIGWIANYQRTQNWRMAEERRPGGVFPFLETYPMEERTQFLEKHDLSFSTGEAGSLAWLPWVSDREVRRIPQGGKQGSAWILRPTTDGFLNFRARPAENSMEDWSVRLGERRGEIDFENLQEGVSIAVSPGDAWFELMGPESARFGGLTISPHPVHPSWAWRDGMLQRDRGLKILAGFHGWEEADSFGWTTDRLEAEVSANAESWLNIRLDSRFDAVDTGPISLQMGSRTWEFNADQLKMGVSLRLPESSGTETLVLANAAGARSPAELGLWADERKLALRLAEFSISKTASFAELP